MADKAGVITIGAIIGVIGIGYVLSRRAKAKPPIPPLDKVYLSLKNPPSGANRWGVTLLDWTATYQETHNIYEIPGETKFDIPDYWEFPLRFWISIVYYDGVDTTILHQRQSENPDWPDYIEQFIPDFGYYYYNVATEQFEVG